MSKTNHTISRPLIKIAGGAMSMAILVGFSLPMLAQNLPSNLPTDRERINNDFFGGNSTNASERFFEQGEYQIEQEVIELEQTQQSHSEDDQLLEVNPEAADDNIEIQQFDQVK